MLYSSQIFLVLTARNWWSGIWRWTQDAGYLSLHPTKIRVITRLPGKPTLEGQQRIHTIMRAAGIWSLCLALLVPLSSVQNNFTPFLSPGDIGYHELRDLSFKAAFRNLFW